MGSYQWVERRLFEVLGSWVASEPVPEAQVLFDVYSQQHAWHAELFADRLPALDSVDSDALILPPSAEVERMLGVLAGARARRRPDTPTGSTPDGSGVSDVPGRAARCRVWWASAGWCWPDWSRATPSISDGSRRSSDAPMTRCLRLVLRDETEEWQAVEALTKPCCGAPTTSPWSPATNSVSKR